MHCLFSRIRRLIAAAMLLTVVCGPSAAASDTADGRYLYVAAPGIRNYLEYGGHGLLVFDIDHGHRFVRRIPLAGVDADGVPINIKGICANATTGLLHVSTLRTLMCLDLATDELLWERAYEGGCDRMASAPDGSFLYLPSLEQGHWHVVDARTGDVLAKVVPNSGAHNTIVGLDGRHAYLAGLRSPLLRVTDTRTHRVIREVGPFTNNIRPFTVNGQQTLCFVNVNELLGFEIGDLRTGEKLHRVEVTGFEPGPVKRHGCPSHGIGLTPDETQVWVSDGHNSHVHVFDATVMPPRQVASIPLRDQPGWITFSLDGRYAWPSSGEVIDVASRKIVTALTDETGREVGSEKVVEIHFRDGRPVRTGDQFGLGRVTRAQEVP